MTSPLQSASKSELPLIGPANPYRKFVYSNNTSLLSQQQQTIHTSQNIMSSHTYEFNVTMTCGGCSGAIDRVLKKLEGT